MFLVSAAVLVFVCLILDLMFLGFKSVLVAFRVSVYVGCFLLWSLLA